MHTLISPPRPDLAHRPQLSLYTGPQEASVVSAGGSRLSLGSTTSELYWQHARPSMEARGARARNFEAYETALAHWVRITADPPLGEIDDTHCTRFVTGLAALPGRRAQHMAPNTVRKTCIEIEAIWKWAGPRSKQCRHALDLFRDENGSIVPLPWLDPPPPEENDDEGRWFAVAELQAIVSACHVATAPVDGLIPPWLWWQCLIRCAFYTGLRIGSLLALEYSWIAGDQLVIPAAAMKKRRAFRKPLDSRAGEAIELIRTPGRQRIFLWPHTLKTLYRHLDRILAEAGLAGDRRPPKFHGLRRSHGEGLADIDLDAVQISLGHQSQKTAALYVRRKTKVAKAIAGLPDLGGHSRRVDPQTGQRMLPF